VEVVEKALWDVGGATDAWGRPLGAIKALLIAGETPPCDNLLLAARWALDAGAVDAESPIGRYAGVLALLVLGRDAEAGELAATLGEEFPSDVSAALAALAAHDADAYRAAVASVRRSFEEREAFLEDLPVADTALALDALARRSWRGGAATVSPRPPRTRSLVEPEQGRRLRELRKEGPT